MPETTSMPTREQVEEVTRQNLKGKLDDEAIGKYLDAAAGPPHIPANGSLKFAGVVGTVECGPTEEHSEQHFRTTVYGGGFADVSGVVGTLSTSIGWAKFFQETTGCHVQTTSIYGGWLQINFFRELELIGQFNGLAVGIGIVEAGGNGHWRKR